MLKTIALGLLLFVQLVYVLAIYHGGSKEEKQARTKAYFSVTLILFLAWLTINLALLSLGALEEQISYVKVGISTANYLNKAGFLSVGLATLSTSIFISRYNKETGKKSYADYLTYIPSAALCLLPFFDSFSGLFIPSSNPSYFVFQYGALSIAPIILMSTVMIRLLFGVFSKGGNTRFSGVHLGLFLTYLHGLLFVLVIPVLTNSTSTLFIGYLCPFYTIIISGYTLFRNRVFNLRTSVFRAVGYSLSIATLVLMYSLVIYGIVLPIISPGEGFKFSVLLLIAGGTAGTIYFYDKVKLVFDVITEKLFFKSNYSLPKFLDEFNQTLINSGGVEELASNVMNVIAGTLKTDFLILAVKNDDFEITIDSRTKEPGREKYEEKITPFMTTYHFKESQRVVLRDYIDKNKYPELYEILLAKDTPIAIDLSEASTGDSTLKQALGKHEQKILFLGPKKSGESYSVQDFDALRIISKELVVALQNSMRFEEIKLFNLDLQRKVEIATLKLRQQNKKLVAADELKDDFLSIASHQMRTPISTILGYTSILSSGDAGAMSKEQEKFAKVVENSTKRLAYLINDFLTVSRLKSGKFAIEKTKTDLKAALKNEVESLKNQFEAKNVKLSVQIDRYVPEMNADEQKLRQVMMNLMDNALHYTPEAGKVEVSLKSEGKNISFEVKDNGIGVPKSEQAQLFSKMFRAGNAQKMRPDGTGLGLYLAKKVVLGHDGHIIFRSKEGEGSTFGFKIPIK